MRNNILFWFSQRLSGMLIALYAIFVVAFIASKASFDFYSWKMLYANPAFKFYTIIIGAMIVYHAWSGLWMVITDYIKNAILALILHLLTACLSCYYLAWHIKIVIYA